MSAEAYPLALRLLSLRDRSEAELKEKLRRKDFSEAKIKEALDRCRELGYIDDERFARQRCHALLRSGRAVGPRLRLELRKAGVDEKIAEEAALEVGGEYDRRRLLIEILERRYAGFSYESSDERERRRVVGYFLRRGFPSSLTLSILKER